MAAPFFCAGTQGIDGFFHMGCQGIRVRELGTKSGKDLLTVPRPTRAWYESKKSLVSRTNRMSELGTKSGKYLPFVPRPTGAWYESKKNMFFRTNRVSELGTKPGKDLLTVPRLTETWYESSETCMTGTMCHVGAAKIIKKAAAPGAGLARIILLARPAADGRLLL